MPARHENARGLLIIASLFIVYLVVFTRPTLAFSGWPIEGIPDSLGVSVHFTAEDQFAEYERQMDQIADIGLKIVRIDNAWRWTDASKYEYDFKFHHKLVDACEKRGLRVLTILVFCDPRYENKLCAGTVGGRRAYARFCAAMVREFKGRGVIWEMWNEANSPTFWQPEANVDDYMAAAKMAIKAMRKVDSECVIIAPSTAGMDFRFIESSFKQGLLDIANAVSVHPYATCPEINFQHYLQLSNLINQYSKTSKGATPIVCSELGFGRVVKGVSENLILTQDDQASLIVRSIIVDQMAQVPMHIVYTNRDYTDKLVDSEETYGLVTHDGKPKAAYHAVKTLINQLSGLKFEKRLMAGRPDPYMCPSTDYSVIFRNAEKAVVVAWTSAESHIAKVEIPRFSTVVEATDMKGNGIIPMPPAVNGAHPGEPWQMVKMRITSEPVYLRLKMGGN